MKPMAPALGLALVTPAASLAQSTWTDPVGDAVIRETTNGGIANFNENALPDIVSLTITPWEPTDPATDLYTGQVVPAPGARFFRLDLVFQGFFNPIGLLVPFIPTAVGDRPVAFNVEIDIDNNPNSGGEFEPFARERYLGNVARFSTLPTGVLGQRAAKSRADYDNIFSIGNQFERSGIDLTLAFCGCARDDLVTALEVGDFNGVMDPGETMFFNGPFFERFRALDPFSVISGGSFPGKSDARVEVRFQHDIPTDRTTATFVYPLTNEGSAALRGDPFVEPIDFIINVNSQHSVQETLAFLVMEASFCCNAQLDNQPDLIQLLIPWQNPQWRDMDAVLAQVNPFLDPAQWRAVVVAGTPYTQNFVDPYVWTDVGGGGRFADLNHDGVLSNADIAEFDATLAAIDGDPNLDQDQTVNGVFDLPIPGKDFQLININGDGVVDTADRSAIILARTDLNGDGAINGSDLTFILSSFGPCPGCPADLNGDGVVGGGDITFILSNWSP